MATAGSKEKRQLEKVKRTFEKVYQEKAETSKNNKYSVANTEDSKYNRSNLELSSVKEGELVNEFHNALTPKQWVKYHSKMNKVMANTYGNLNRTDVIDGKVISTEIKKHKEQVVGIIKIKESTQNILKYIVEEANNYGYSGQQVENAFIKMYGEKNVSRYDISSGKFRLVSELGGNKGKTVKDNRQSNRERVERRNRTNNRGRSTKELDNSSFSLDKNCLWVWYEISDLSEIY